MTRIRVLPDQLVNKIAAGEVVERPASVVKELLENAIDAGATEIRVTVEEGGRRLIRVEDNGCGMNGDDALLAFERHATSKIREAADLDRIGTLGFRGEALPSIGAVSRVRLLTSDGSQPEGTEIVLEGGTLRDVRAGARARGTTLEVRTLFYNTPARRKFLKSGQTELSHVTGTATEIALAHPDIHFTLQHEARTLLKAPAVDSMVERAYQIFGKEVKQNLMEVEVAREGLHLFGFVSVPGYTRPNGTHINFFVNRRAVREKTLRHAVYAAYETLLMKGRHPMVYLFLDVDPAHVDVNVHPAKREVRFTDQRRIHDFVRDGVRMSVQSYGREEEAAPVEVGHRPQVNPREDRVREAVESYLREQAQEPQERRDRPAPSRHITSAGILRSEGKGAKPPVRALFEERLIPMGQLSDTFIISQDKEGLILVDQHAAHERILFERFKKHFEQARVPVQRLLVPVTLEASGKEAILLKEHTDLFDRLGMEIEDFGNRTFAVKGVPVWVADADVADLIRATLGEIESLERSGTLEQQMDAVIHLFSCRGAIKANRRLKPEEMEKLLAELGRTDSPHTCEHGRPTMIRIDRQEIEKMFRRR
jgi:DNA mismatch repair protein MutL